MLKIKYQLEIMLNIVLSFAIYGLIAPTLISYDNDLIVITGILLVVITIILQINWIISFYKKIN